MRRPRRGLLAFVLAGALAGCSTLPATPPPLAPVELSGRMALKVDAAAGAEAHSLTTVFELGGGPQAGRLDLSTPLGTLLGRARWADDGVTLSTPQGDSRWPDLDAMTRELLGESVPVVAMFDWLRGRPWPGAPSRSDGVRGFEQLGWAVDLSRFDDALLTAVRAAPPAVTVRVKLDRP